MESISFGDGAVSFVHDNGRFSFVDHNGDVMDWPRLSFNDPADKPEDESSPHVVPIEEADGELAERIRAAAERLQENIATDCSYTPVDSSDMVRLSEFIEREAPWSSRFANSDRYDFGVSSVCESFNILESVAEPMVIALCLTKQAFADIDISWAVSDGYYRCTNIAVPESVERAVDIRELTLAATGMYTRELASALIDFVRGEPFVSYPGTEGFAVAGLLRGLPPEYAVDALRSWRFIPDDFDMNGVPELPEWLENEHFIRRAEWSKSLSVLSVCIDVSRSVPDMSEVDTKTSDVFELHSSLVEAAEFPADDDVNLKTAYNRLDGPDSVHVGNFDISNTVTGEELCIIGDTTGLCVGGKTYRNRLSAGLSVFFCGRDSTGTPRMVVETDSAGDLIEIKGVGNTSVPDNVTDGVMSSIHESWTGWETAAA